VAVRVGFDHGENVRSSGTRAYGFQVREEVIPAQLDPRGVLMFDRCATGGVLHKKARLSNFEEFIFDFVFYFLIVPLPPSFSDKKAENPSAF
jgi:hypothetical protein